MGLSSVAHTEPGVAGFHFFYVRLTELRCMIRSLTSAALQSKRIHKIDSLVIVAIAVPSARFEAIRRLRNVKLVRSALMALAAQT